MDIRVGVLALQGAFREHIKSLENCGVSAAEIKSPDQLDDIDALIIPGGESTTIRKLLEKYKFRSRLDKFYKDGKPIFVTCAGLVLIAKNIKGEGMGLGYIDVDVERLNVGEKVEILGKFGQEAVLIRENNIIASTFHPELTDDLRIHRYFISMIKHNKGEN
jgi:5'-phosphate synthase pdxT subunit